MGKRYPVELGLTIESGGNLNGYRTPNVWSVPSAAIAATITNIPNQNTGGKLMVEWLGNANYVKQTYITHVDTVYTRAYDGATWTTWKCLTEWINQTFDSISILENSAYLLSNLNFGLNNGTDLNSTRTPGVYQISTATEAATMKNLPITSYGGRIIVQCLGNAGNVKQSFLCHNGITYERLYSGSEWKTWRKLSTEAA